MKLPFFALAFFALLSPAFAQTIAPPQQTRAQVDGITTAITDKLWENTDRYWHDGDYYRIMALIRVVGEADPTFAEAYSNGAWLLWSMGDFAAADAFLQRGLANAPTNLKWQLEYEYGYALFAYKKDYRAALPHLKAAVKYPNAPVLAFTNLAHCYERTGDLSNSRTTWAAVVEKFPAFSAGPSNLRRVTAKLKSQNGV